MKTNDQLSSEDRALVQYVNEILGSDNYAETQDDRVHLAIVDALLETVPRARPSFRSQLRSATQAASLEQTKFRKPRAPYRRLLIPSMALILLVALIAATPQGRSFAQQALGFFTRATNDTVTEPMLVPFFEIQSYSTLEEAESAIGFLAKTPKTLPTGYALDSVHINWAEQALIITYRGPSNQTPVMTPQMNLTQRKLPFDDLIGPSAEIEALTVDGDVAEYVAGGWLYVDSTREGQGKEFHWEESMVPAQTLRWMSDGFYFEISFVGSDTQPGFLGPEDLIKVAETID